MESNHISDPLDKQLSTPLSKRLWTIRFLIIGSLLIFTTFIISAFWQTIGLHTNHTIWLAISLMISFGVNIAGFIIGFVERKKNPKRALFGIIANFILISLFIFIVVVSIAMMNEN